MSNKTYITWKTVIEDINDLAERTKHVDVILQIGRGGCIPGTLLAYRNNIKTVFTLTVQSYNDSNKQQLINPLQIPEELFCDRYANSNILVVDDISDSGTTLEYVREIFKRYKIRAQYCSLYIKPETTFVPDYYCRSYDNDTWLEFPWDDLTNPLFLS